MSHELRTPLNGILGYTQLLRQDRQLTPKNLQAVDTIHRSGEHLLEMINDVLDLSKIEAGKLELRSRDFRLSHALNTIVEMSRINAGQKGLDFSFDLDPRCRRSSLAMKNACGKC
jgi:signal transduction histidine kinase